MVGMELTYSPEAEAYREEVRSWLRENLPQGWFEPGFEMTPEQRKAFNESWPAKLYGGGWICATWPKEYGGRGASQIEQGIFAEESARARAPEGLNIIGRNLVGPTLMRHGSEAQRRRFLPNLHTQRFWLEGEKRWVSLRVSTNALRTIEKNGAYRTLKKAGLI